MNPSHPLFLSLSGPSLTESLDSSPWPKPASKTPAPKLAPMPAPKTDPDREKPPLTLLRFRAVQKDPVVLPGPVLGVLSRGDLGLICGQPGVGKSWLALQVALSVASARDLCSLGASSKPEPSLYVTASTDSRKLRWRLATVAKMLPASADPDLAAIPLTRRTPLLNGERVTDSAIRLFQAMQGRVLSVLDPLPAFHDIDTWDAPAWDTFARLLTQEARACAQALIVVCGETPPEALLAECRVAWTLRLPDKDDGAELDAQSHRVLVQSKPPGAGPQLFAADAETGLLRPAAWPQAPERGSAQEDEEDEEEE